MQTLENKDIIYDDVCPMCKGYTACFLHFGLLQNRTGFASASPEMLERIDLNRARHEIPLYDQQTGQTLYGLDALFLILGERFPVFRPLFRNRVFRAALYQLYQIITYNRRVIAGSKAPAAGFDCAPDVNLFYRFLYIGLAFFGTAMLFRPIATPPALLACLFMLQGTALAIAFFTAKKLDFAGHWATIFLVSALLWRMLPDYPIVQIGILAWICRMWYKRIPLLF